MSRALRLAYFGTPDIAVPAFDALNASRHALVCAVTQPDRARGRGRKASPCPVAARAREAGVTVLQPASGGGAKEPETLAALEAARPDLGVVLAFGQFLGKRVRELPACGYLLNAHASILPAYRGAAPIARAILAGERETGISMMRIEREMDAGPVAFVRRLAIGSDEDCGSLTARLGELAAEAMLEAVEQVADDTIEFHEQDHAAASFAPKLEREETRIDWREPAEALVRRVRAFAPRPGAFTHLAGQPLRILAASCEEGPAGEPGRVSRADGGLRVATGDGWLVPRTVQRAGGKAMDTDAFLRGRDIPDGAHLGGEAEA